MPGAPRERFRPVSWEPGRIDWLASGIQLVGTILFNVSTFAALQREPVSAAISNIGTAAGALGFLVGAILLIPESMRSADERAATPAVSTA